ncbi:hypothetical protein L3Q82_020887, partial [Scortum barcoo]
MTSPTTLATISSVLPIALCDWILNFLTGRPQAVRMGSTTSSTLTLNTGAPQGCVLSPLLYSLFTHDCVATHSSNTIVKFADDTTVIGLITGDDETAYREVRGQSPDILVPGQQPPSQHQQNKGADRGLQEEAERGTRPPLHQRDYGGESQQLQVPRGSHQRGPDLDSSHSLYHKVKPDSGSSSSSGCGGSTWTPRILCSFY